MSGRGVGMDVVKSNIERIGGTIDIQSEPGAGTTVRLRIPLTLAVIPALVIRCGAERFAIPQATVLEVVPLGHGFQAVEQIRDSRMYRLRDALIPVLALRELLGQPPGAGARHLVVLQVGTMVFGLAVDAIGDTEEIVVKNLPRFLQALGVYAGVTIMGDGRASLILDVAGLLQAGGLDAQPVAEPEPEEEAEADGTFQRMLLVRLGDRVYAVPMGLVSRLEEFPAARLERIGDRAVVQYGRDLLPIVEPHAVLGLAAPEGDSLRVAVFGEGKRKVGLRVDAILDVVADHMAIHPVAGATAVVGAAVIHGRATELLDVHHVIGSAMPGWAPGAGNGDGKTILLVEDSAFFRSLVRSHLEGQGYRILEAGNGEEGLKVFERQPVNLVLSDIEMPRVDGLAFVKRLRALEAGRRVPAIALTSVTSDETRQAALSAGFDRYLAKYDREAVTAVLAELQPMEEPVR
jgi:two-component system chemotaxis sensor kinase CheA